MEFRIKQLIKRLSVLGYCSFEIKNIIRHVTGGDDVTILNGSQEVALIGHLEMYEQLGRDYLLNYSK